MKGGERTGKAFVYWELSLFLLSANSGKVILQASFNFLTRNKIE